MIEVVQRNHKGNFQTLGFYTEKEFVETFEVSVSNDEFSSSDIDRYKEYVYIPSFQTNTTVGVFCKVAYNEKGKILPVSYLVGIIRRYQANRISRWRKKFFARNGNKKSVYGHHRHMHTFQERKWAHAWDDEEDAPRYRGARQGHNLPDPWDDVWSWAQKSWKWQSKRKHQWKDNETN